MNILLPTTITDSMVASASIAEPDAGEIAWVSGGTYAVGDRCIRTETHRIYECVQSAAGRAVAPESDATYWLDIGPTNRWAPFDQYVSTAVTATTSISYTLRPGWCNAMALYGLTGSQIEISALDAPGGTEIYHYSAALYEEPEDWYEYLFLPLRPLTKLVLSDLQGRPNPEITITVSATAGASVAIGMIVVGDLRPFVRQTEKWGGTEYGATSEPTTYSYIKTADDGTTRIVRRNAATNMTATVAMPRASADQAVDLLQQVLDVPVAWIATPVAGYQGLNVFGLGSGKLTYESASVATLTLTIKGMI